MKKHIQDLLDRSRPHEITGTADIDISAADYTAYVEILKIEPKSPEGLHDLNIALDLNKATTGWDTVSTGSDTLDLAVFMKTDGTNFRHVESASQLTAVGDGSHETAGVLFKLGPVGPGADVSVRAKLNAERADAEIPYRITYRGERAPDVTPVAAG